MDSIKLFLAYSESDWSFLHALEEQLELLSRTRELAGRRGLARWGEHKLVPGEDSHVAMQRALEEAEVVILLISSSFLAGSFCWGPLVRDAIRRYYSSDILLLPLMVRPCLYAGTPLNQIGTICRHKPVSRWTDRSLVWPEVGKNIQEAIDAWEHRNPAKTYSERDPTN